MIALCILLLSSCAKHNLKNKEKGIIELGIATGLMLKAASCYAEVKTDKVKISVGSRSSNNDEEEDSYSSSSSDEEEERKNSRSHKKKRDKTKKRSKKKEK